MTTDFLRYQRGTVYTIKRGLIQFKIINFSNSTILNNLVNEGKLYGIKLQRFEKVAVELIYFTVVTIQSRHQLLERRANARNVTYCKHKDQKRNYRALPMWLMLPNGNELPLSQCFRYLDHVCFRLFPSPLQATRNKIAYIFLCSYACLSLRITIENGQWSCDKKLIDRIQWGPWGKYLALGHETGTRARSVDHDPEPNNFPSGPSTQSIRTQYFGFVRHTFIAHDVIEHKK